MNASRIMGAANRRRRGTRAFIRASLVVPGPAAQKGVADGIRTRDRRHHKPELYQLSYCHRAATQSTEPGAGAAPAPRGGRRRRSGSGVAGDRGGDHGVGEEPGEGDLGQ